MANLKDAADDVPADWHSILTNAPIWDWKAPGEGAPKEDGSGEGGPQCPNGDSYFSQAKDWAIAHPFQAAAFGSGALVMAAPAIVASPALAAAGFGANGIVGGSVAAGVQSGIGSVVAPGLFATLQSAGAAGYGVAAVHGTVQGVALAATGAGAWASKKMANEEKKQSGDAGDDEGNEDGEPEDGEPENGGQQP
ncbi:hypothetical protein AK830_g8802 [Neonectria ditissima]|uniref:Uncharacterized protein n=1 Tax=Neonectria ditissima TaxID=78410 RepID=A0A0P7BBF3_9HYPO|nr:hypothetical protein AK830_g8802 [Neonectria ditissima]